MNAGRFFQRARRHVVRAVCAPFLLPGLVSAWAGKGRTGHDAVAARLRERTQGRDVVLAVVGDTHADDDGADDLHQCIADLAPDAVVHLGDFSNEGGLWEWLVHVHRWSLWEQNAHAGLFQVLGNHDKRTLGGLWQRVVFGPATAVLDLGAWRVILLDNTAKGDCFSAASVAFMEALAKDGARPSVLCLHRPPVCDRWQLRTAQQLVPEMFTAAKVAGVQAVFSGHIHLYDKETIHGIDTYISGGGTRNIRKQPFGTPGRHVLKVTLPADPAKGLQVDYVKLYDESKNWALQVGETPDSVEI